MTEEPAGQAAANRVLAEFDLALHKAAAGLRFIPGNDETVVVDGLLSTVILAKPRPTRSPVYSYRNESRIRFKGTTLIFEDPAEGAHSPFTISGLTFEDGVGTATDMRSEDGGFLVYRYSAALTIVGTNVVRTFATAVDLLNYDTWSVNTIPTAKVNAWNTDANQTIETTPGVLYQLCAQYDPRGKVTIYQRFPKVSSGAGSHFSFIG